MNVTISDYSTNYIRLNLGDYYPGTTLESCHYFPHSDWQGICEIQIGGEVGIEFHVKHESTPFYLTDQLGQTNFMTVDSVNGVAPTDLQDLIDKILVMIN